MARLCPDCHIPLSPQTFEGLTLDVCSRCAGVWFNAEELRTLMATDPFSLATLEARTSPHLEHVAGPPARQSCPNCGVLLQEYHYLYNSPIVLHACPQCEGCWVQKGELLAIQQWRDHDRSAVAAEEAQRLQLAQAQIEHENVMAHYEHITSLLEMLRYYNPMWMRWR